MWDTGYPDKGKCRDTCGRDTGYPDKSKCRDTCGRDTGYPDKSKCRFCGEKGHVARHYTNAWGRSTGDQNPLLPPPPPPPAPSPYPAPQNNADVIMLTMLTVMDLPSYKKNQNHKIKSPPFGLSQI